MREWALPAAASIVGLLLFGIRAQPLVVNLELMRGYQMRDFMSLIAHVADEAAQRHEVHLDARCLRGLVHHQADGAVLG